MSKDKKYKFTSARETAEKMESGFGMSTLVLPEKTKLFKLKSDKTIKIDIIPYRVGKGNRRADEGMVHWEREYHMHRGIGANNESVVCLARTSNKKCPVCQFVSGLQRDAKASDETIKGLLPKQRQLFNVIDVNNREDGIQVWDVAPFNFGDLLQKMISDSEEGEGWDDFSHPEKGSTLKLGVSEATMGDGGKFFKVVSIQLVPRKKPYKMSIIDKAPCLDECIKELDYDALKDKLEEADPSESKKRWGKKKDKDSDSDKESDHQSDSDGDSDSDSASSDSDGGSDSDSGSDASDSDRGGKSDSDRSSDSDKASDSDDGKGSDSDSDSRSDSDSDSGKGSDDEEDKFEKEVSRKHGKHKHH